MTSDYQRRGPSMQLTMTRVVCRQGKRLGARRSGRPFWAGRNGKDAPESATHGETDLEISCGAVDETTVSGQQHRRTETASQTGRVGGRLRRGLGSYGILSRRSSGGAGVLGERLSRYHLRALSSQLRAATGSHRQVGYHLPGGRSSWGRHGARRCETH